MLKKHLLFTLILSLCLLLGLSGAAFATGLDPEVPAEDPAPAGTVIDDAWVALADDSFVCDGTVHSPEVAVTDPADEALTEGEDYTLIRTTGRKDPGVYAVIVTGAGDYTGTATKLFTVVPAAVQNLSASVKGSTAIELTWNTVRGATGYRVYARTAEEADFAPIDACAKTTYTASGLLPKTDYVFRVEAVYDNAEDGVLLTGEAAEAAAKTASGTQANFTVTVSPERAVYNGNIRTPDVTVKDEEGNVLVVSTDYTSALESGRTDPGVYRVIVSGRGAYKGTVEESFRIVPAAPAGLTAAATGENEITLNWTASYGATAYEVFAAAGDGEAVSLGLTEETSFVASGLTPETTYTFTVAPRAVTERGTLIGDTSEKSCMAQGKPAAPADLAADASLGKAVLTWSAAEHAAKYKVFMLNAETEEYELKTTVTGTTYTVTDLESDVEYFFRVTTVRVEAGLTLESDDYAEVSATPFMTAPDVPTNIKATGSTDGSGSARLTWTASYGATQYNIYRYKGDVKRYVYIGTSYGTSYVCSGLTLGYNYYFKVVPVRKADGMTWVGAYSDPVLARADLVISNFQVTKSSSSMTLSWDANAGCTQYNIYIDGSYKTTVYPPTHSYTVSGSGSSRVSGRFAVDPVRKKDGSTYVGPRTTELYRQNYTTGTPRLLYKVTVSWISTSYLDLNYDPLDHCYIKKDTTTGYFYDLSLACGSNYNRYTYNNYYNGKYYQYRYYGKYYNYTYFGADAYCVEFWRNGSLAGTAYTSTDKVDLKNLNLAAGTYSLRIYGYNYNANGNARGAGYYSDTVTIS